METEIKRGPKSPTLKNQPSQKKIGEGNKGSGLITCVLKKRSQSTGKTGLMAGRRRPKFP